MGKVVPTKVSEAHTHTYLLSVCLSTAPEQISCIRRVLQSRIEASLLTCGLQIVPSMEPTKLSRSFRAAYSIDLLCSSVGIPSYSYQIRSDISDPPQCTKCTWNIRPRDSHTTQCNSPKTVIFERKNELPQAGLKPATFCVLCRHSTNWATEAAQLVGSNHTYKATQLKAKCLNLKIRWTVHIQVHIHVYQTDLMTTLSQTGISQYICALRLRLGMTEQTLTLNQPVSRSASNYYRRSNLIKSS